MTKWLRRIRGALGMGLTWTIGWGFVGGLIELVQEFVPGWNGAIIDIWPMALAAPAFLGGVAFSMVLGIAGRRRRLDELSLPRFAAWGALGGGLVGGFIAIMGIVEGFAGWGVAVGSTVTLLCAASAAGSLALARRAEERALLDAGAEMDEIGLTAGETEELLGGSR